MPCSIAITQSRSPGTGRFIAALKALRHPRLAAKVASISGGNFQEIAVGVGDYGFVVAVSGEARLAYDADS